MAQPQLKPKAKAATYADIEALPPHMTGEIAYGVLHTMGRPSPQHIRAAGGLNFSLSGPFDFGNDGPGGWVFLSEPELHLGPHVLVPDIAGWHRERLPALPKTAWIEVAPDWVCEILSPSTRRFDRTDKFAIYATLEVKHCWYIDPIDKTLEVFARQGDKWLLDATFKDSDPVAAPPFEVHTFALDVLWMPEG
jgi:Uma2 family endonuclease